MALRPYRRKAQFYETDGMGIIYHGNYIHWMEEARLDMLEQLGWPYEKVRAAGLDFGVTETACRHLGMVRFGDTVEIVMTMPHLSPARLELGYTIADAATGEVRAEGRTGHFFWDMARQRPVAMKRAEPALYALLAELAGEERRGGDPWTGRK